MLKGLLVLKVFRVFKVARDDESDCPLFALISGKPKSTVFDGLYYIGLDDLELVETQDNHEYSTNKPLLLLYIQQQYPDDKVLKDLVESL